MIRPYFHFLSILLLTAFLSSCATYPKGSFRSELLPRPVYSEKKFWAALPSEIDSADAVPIPIWKDEQAHSPVDVFFIHPTTYTGKANSHQWNADITNEKINLKTDKYPIRYQASIFNGAGRVYAPRYRQAHLRSFYEKKQIAEARESLDFAYEDVRNAFQYYLDHYNQGRPFIIAAHSQGTYHAGKLLLEFVDGKPLQEKFIVAYIPGLPVASDYFKNLSACITPEETGCICSWRTVREGTLLNNMHYPEKDIIVTNPITWSCDEEICEKDVQQGAILRDFNTLVPSLVGAEVYKDFLWVNKPLFPGSFLLTTKNYHIADYNFFYADVRKNAQDRVRAYLEQQ